jgi:predicted amidophosphoribosyltransferase
MSDETRTCRECGASFTWTPAQADWLERRLAVKGAAYFPPSLCNRCQAEAAVRRDPTFRVEICPDCGQPFAAGPSLTRPGVLCRACWQATKEDRK